MPDSRSVLFARRAPDGDGVLHWDLSAGSRTPVACRPITRGETSPTPTRPPMGAAVGVRVRFGRSTLVRVDLGGGSVTDLAAAPSGGAEGTVRVGRSGPSAPLPTEATRRPPAPRRALAARRAAVKATAPRRAGRDRPAGSPVAPPAWSADGRGSSPPPTPPASGTSGRSTSLWPPAAPARN
jgi:hypothetical protein